MLGTILLVLAVVFLVLAFVHVLPLLFAVAVAVVCVVAFLLVGGRRTGFRL
jgi:hypothetical protein